MLSASEDFLTAPVLGRSSFISLDYAALVIPMACTHLHAYTQTDTDNTLRYINMCEHIHTHMHTHTHTHMHAYTHTRMHILKKQNKTSNSRAHCSLRIQAANAGACGCCLLDISLPKGIYFILPSNPLSSQFSQDHIFSYPPSLFSETFGERQ